MEEEDNICSTITDDYSRRLLDADFGFGSDFFEKKATSVRDPLL